MKNWLFLFFAIIAEVIATSSLKASQGFTKPGFSLVVIIGYGVAFYFLSLTLRTIPVGVAYAVWSGIGIMLVTFVAFLVYGQKLNGPSLVGIGLITAGVIILSLFSKTPIH